MTPLCITLVMEALENLKSRHYLTTKIERKNSLKQLSPHLKDLKFITLLWEKPKSMKKSLEKEVLNFQVEKNKEWQ